MPIRGLTDKIDLSFPFIGSIRKGAAKTDAKRPGADLTYFRAVFTEQEAAAAAAFAAAYGPHPTELNIILPFPDPERNFECWQEEYTAGAIQHRCDGVTCVLWRDGRGEIHHDAKPCPGGCKPVGRLKVIIPELRRLAFVVVHTTSVHDVQEITRNLAALRALTGNGVNGIPLVLRRRPRLISTPSGDGKRARRQKWLLSIEADPKWVERKLAEMERLATPGLPELPALAAPEVALPDAEADPDEDADTDEIEGEYTEDGEQVGGDATGGDAPEGAKAATEGGAGPATPQPAAVAGANGAAATPGAQSATKPEAPTNANGRPYAPDVVKERFVAHVAEAKPALKSAVISPEQLQKLAICLSEAVRDDNDSGTTVDLKRHSIIAFLTGKTSSKALSMAEASAMIHWLQDPDASREEAHLIIRAAMEAAGQAPLPGVGAAPAGAEESEYPF